MAAATQADYKPQILEALRVLYDAEKAANEPFKARAYATVIRQVETLAGPVHTIDDLSAVKGIGAKIHAQLTELFSTGHMSAADRVKANATENTNVIQEAHAVFEQIYGVGPKMAHTLVHTHGLRTIAELRDRVQTSPALLNGKQRIGLMYYEPLLERIPRAEMDRHAKLLVSFSPVNAEVVGSYRREAATSGDIDVLLRMQPDQTVQEGAHQLHELVATLVKRRYILEVLALGDHKCMAICRLTPQSIPRRLDLLMTPDVEYPYALLYFTGSGAYNTRVRAHALTRGVSLNEHGLTPPPPKPLRTEEEIIAYLGLEYVAPKDR